MSTGTVSVVHYPVVLRELEVLAFTDLTPRMRRVSLGGSQLQAFSRDGWNLTPFHTGGFDDHVKLFFPAPGESEPVLPIQDEGHLDWPDDGPRPLHRDYTVRRWDAAAQRLDLDVVLHEGGVASSWAATAAPGDRVHLAGPKMSTLLPAASSYLFAGDETALPSIARWAEETDTVNHAVIEVADAAEEQQLDPRLAVTWVHRDAGGDLASAVRALPELAPDCVAWVAGEAGAVRDVRRHLRNDRGLGADRMHATGYWRRGTASGIRPINLDSDLDEAS